MAVFPRPQRLKKELTLFDVYAISTGAMFSSGFFLLPGLAAAKTGPSVVLAYLLAGVFILPAMFSVAELATAMPRAGGAYYFLDRALGPMVGTVGGLGTWLALVLKSAFALIGIGAYLGIFYDVPIKPVAVALTLVFAAVNVLGTKETGGLQRLLVTVLVVILAFFIVQGTVAVFTPGVGAPLRERFVPFLAFGPRGLFATIGFVFVSYAGLTKVASVAEEVRDPDRNIPLGMMLSLLTATAIYVIGVFIMVSVLDPAELRSDLTPVATAAQAFFGWLPGETGLVLIVVAAIAAFASTGNAGIMSASRYPLAMARDRLLWERFAEIGRMGTPTRAIMATAALMVFVILALDIEGVAKLASAFQLLLFALLNLAVIVMRESRIESYAPGYRSPLYPWMQIFGFLTPFWLIAEMGELAILFTIGLVGACIGWYFYYARGRVVREGAVLHTFARMGERRSEGLDRELRGILKEKGLRDEDRFDEVVARAAVIDAGSASFAELAERAGRLLAARLPVPAETLAAEFLRGTQRGATPVSHGVALPHLRIAGVEHPEMVLVRCAEGVGMEPGETLFDAPAEAEPIRAVFFLTSPEGEAGQHLRFLAQIATRVDDPEFMSQWLAADGEALKHTLLQDERVLLLHLRPGSAADPLIGRSVRDLRIPEGTLIALVRREGGALVPRGGTMLREGDRLTVIGDPAGIAELAERFGEGRPPSAS
ncbi:MAG: amino acid permease [Gemmatimonadota bacterium]|nr:amino acid permease [Gemmatimonadota bacterium]